jgi:type II secretion system protein G
MESQRESQLTPLAVILLVVLLLVFLAGALIPRFARLKAPYNPPDHQTMRTMSNLKTAIDTFEVDNGRLPRQDEGFAVLLEAPPDLKGKWAGPYVESDTYFLDQWGHPFRYMHRVKGSTEEFNIISAGPDGVFGTEDDIECNIAP